MIKNGVLNGYYYVNDARTGVGGLIEWNGDIYYISGSGKVYTGNLNITEEKANGLVVPGIYTFDAETGKMIRKDIKNGIVDGYYYVDNVKTGIGGLVKWNGNYYYVSKSGKVYVGTFKLTDEQAGKAGLKGGTYTFDPETGAMLNPPVMP